MHYKLEKCAMKTKIKVVSGWGTKKICQYLKYRIMFNGFLKAFIICKTNFSERLII